ncbi:Predicted PurR-regulated permease PerM [Ekhidna lutea]|uniref:Predicted PurR-regulated permease PerM n=2 Tax=Ekhidna lutea TaxID=447679 RepID=A0A239H3B6_EKHLU|nr:Predicted PurR-regulated permease PerM [Ekhidna lutea]
MIFLGIATLYLMRELANLLVPLFFALFFAVLFQPLVHFLQRFLSVNISIAITTILTMAVFFFIGFGIFNVIQALVENSETILESISNDLRPFINDYTAYFGVTFKRGELRELVVEMVQTGQFWSASGSFINSLSGMAAELLMTILYFAGLLGAITQYDSTITYLVGNENKNKEKSLKVFNRIKDSVGSYIKVKTLVSMMTGVGVGIVCLLFGIDYALLWGFLAFVLNYIPYIGSLIAIVPPLVLGIIDSSSVSQVLVIFFCLEGVQLIMGNIIEPKLMGDSFSMNTVSVLFGFVFWAFLWGTAGMLLAVPLTFLFKVILENMSDAGVLVRLMEKKQLVKKVR